MIHFLLNFQPSRVFLKPPLRSMSVAGRMLLLIFCGTAGFGSGASHASDSQAPASEIAKEFDRVKLEYDASAPELLPSHPEAKGQLYSIDLISVEADVDFKSSIAREMVEEIEAIRKTPHIRHYSHCRLVTFPEVRCRERRGHWARVDNGGTIHRRRLDEVEDSQFWEFLGETFEIKLTPMESGVVRTELRIFKSIPQGPPFRLHPQKGDTEPHWQLFLGISKIEVEAPLPNNEFLMLGRGVLTQVSNNVETVTYRHAFLKSHLWKVSCLESRCKPLRVVAMFFKYLHIEETRRC